MSCTAGFTQYCPLVSDRSCVVQLILYRCWAVYSQCLPAPGVPDKHLVEENEQVLLAHSGKSIYFTADCLGKETLLHWPSFTTTWVKKPFFNDPVLQLGWRNFSSPTKFCSNALVFKLHSFPKVNPFDLKCQYCMWLARLGHLCQRPESI